MWRFLKPNWSDTATFKIKCIKEIQLAFLLYVSCAWILNASYLRKIFTEYYLTEKSLNYIMWKIRKKDNIRLTGLKRFFKNNLNKSLNLKCVYSWDPNHLSLEAEILSRCHFLETCWPDASAIPLSDLFVTEQQQKGWVGNSCSWMKMTFMV